jgi:hypothetical protein
MGDGRTLTPREAVEATVWRVLRTHTAGVLAADVDPQDHETVSAVVDPHLPRMQASLAMLMMCLDQGIAAHLSSLQEALHTRTAMDDDLVDDMMEAVAGWSGDDGPPVDM